jgi:DNA-binding transcriptional LysR family regulator
MNFTRLRLLVELERLGTMASVSRGTGMSTSAISKHLAVLEKETGVPLLAPDGRRVRLTPAGRRLAEHAVDILARVETAQAEFDGGGEPVGRVDLVMYTSAAPVVLPALRRAHRRVGLAADPRGGPVPARGRRERPGRRASAATGRVEPARDRDGAHRRQPATAKEPTDGTGTSPATSRTALTARTGLMEVSHPLRDIGA